MNYIESNYGKGLKAAFTLWTKIPHKLPEYDGDDLWAESPEGARYFETLALMGSYAHSLDCRYGWGKGQENSKGAFRACVDIWDDIPRFWGWFDAMPVLPEAKPDSQYWEFLVSVGL